MTKNAAQRCRGSSRDNAASTTPVSRLQVGSVDLSAQHRHLMSYRQQLDILRATVPGELGQHLQDLAQKQVHQRSGHACMVALTVGRTSRRNGTSQPPEPNYEPQQVGGVYAPGHLGESTRIVNVDDRRPRDRWPDKLMAGVWRFRRFAANVRISKCL